MKLSIVTSIYKSEKYINQFIDELLIALDKMKIENYELICVLDGLTDNTAKVLLERKEKLNSLTIIELSRNFGHHYAFLAGMQQAKGEYVMNIDCDLEISPLQIPTFLENIQKDDTIDVVYGYQTVRKGKFVEKYFGLLFWKLINRLSTTTIPYNILTERIMKRDYVQTLVNLPDKNVFLAGMMYWVGYNQVGIPITKKQREGKSSYGIGKRVSLLVEAVTSFSSYPLKLLFIIGIYITLISSLIAIYYIGRKIFFPDSIVEGFVSIIVSIFISTGLIMTSLGLIGIYLDKIFTQTKDRPLFIIKNIIHHDK